MSANQGQDVTLDVMGKSVQGYVAGLDNRGAPGVLVMHAWWGLTPIFKRLCDRLAAEGYIALAANLYGDKTAQTIDEAKQLRELEWTESEQMQAIALAAVDRLRSYGASGGMGIVGFSMGAWWATQLSTLRPDDFRAVVLFYGTGSADFKLSKADFIGHYAATDEWEPTEAVQAMEADIRAAGRGCTFYVYPGVGHWFFEDDRPDVYNPAAAKLAWERTILFLGEKLR